MKWLGLDTSAASAQSQWLGVAALRPLVYACTTSLGSLSLAAALLPLLSLALMLLVGFSLAMSCLGGASSIVWCLVCCVFCCSCEDDPGEAPDCTSVCGALVTDCVCGDTDSTPVLSLCVCSTLSLGMASLEWGATDCRTGQPPQLQ